MLQFHLVSTLYHVSLLLLHILHLGCIALLPVHACIVQPTCASFPAVAHKTRVNPTTRAQEIKTQEIKNDNVMRFMDFVIFLQRSQSLLLFTAWRIRIREIRINRITKISLDVKNVAHLTLNLNLEYKPQKLHQPFNSVINVGI